MSKANARARLEDVLAELEQLESEARDILEDEGCQCELTQLDAYGALSFGSSSNPYDTTLASVVAGLFDKD